MPLRAVGDHGRTLSPTCGGSRQERTARRDGACRKLFTYQNHTLTCMARRTLAERIAETINDEYRRFHAVPSDSTSQNAQFIDLNRQPYGNLYRKLVEEHNAVVTRVDTRITLDPAHGSDNVRIWFSEIEPSIEVKG